MVNELTISSTSQLLNASSGKWDPVIMEHLGISSETMGEVCAPGTILGDVDHPELEMPGTKAIAVCTHDTASAVVSVPFGNEASVFISTGTWCPCAATSIATPFLVPYMLQHLRLGDNFLLTIGLTVVVPNLASLIALRFWGRALDLRHPGRIVTLCCTFWCVTPLFYYFADPGNLTATIWMMAAAWAIGGIFPAGFQIARNLLAARLSGADKTMPAALIWVVVSMGGIVGAGLGTLIVRLGEVRTVFGVSFAARAAAAFVVFLLLVHHPNGVGQGEQ